MESVVASLNRELTESHARLKSVEQELIQREGQITKTSVQLNTSREECSAKSEEVFSYCVQFLKKNITFAFPAPWTTITLYIDLVFKNTY